MNKRVRLPDGKWITVKLPESKPEDLAKASQDEIWTTADGRQILVKDMDARHIANVIKTLKCRAATSINQVNSVLALDEKAVATLAEKSFPIYKRLLAEFERKLGRVSEPQKPERVFTFD